MRRPILLFLLLSFVYHSNLRPVASGDSLPASLLPFSLLLDHTVSLDRFGPYLNQNVPYSKGVILETRGHWYSMYPVVGPLLSAPLYVPLALVPALRRQPPATLIAVARIAEKFTAALWAALAAVILLALLRWLTSERAAWMLTLVYALGTGSWSIASQAMWQHTFGLPAIAGCLYAVERWGANPPQSRWYWLAGASAACALAIRPTNAALVPAVALVLLIERLPLRRWAEVLALPAAAGALTAAYNFDLFQSIGGRYSTTLNAGYFERVAGLLFSPGRGLLIYTPVVLFALAVLAPDARESRRRHRPVVVLAGAFAAIDIGFTATWPVWWGGYCWGPRLLTEILPCVMVLIAAGLAAFWRGGWKPLFAAVALYGCLIQAIGVYCYPKGHWDHLPVSVDVQPGRVWSWNDNPIVRTVRGGFVWEPYAIVAAGMEAGPPAAARKLKELGINAY